MRPAAAHRLIVRSLTPASSAASRVVTRASISCRFLFVMDTGYVPGLTLLQVP